MGTPSNPRLPLPRDARSLDPHQPFWRRLVRFVPLAFIALVYELIYFMPHPRPIVLLGNPLIGFLDSQSTWARCLAGTTSFQLWGPVGDRPVVYTSFHPPPSIFADSLGCPPSSSGTTDPVPLRMQLPLLLGSLLRAVSRVRLVLDDKLPRGVQYARPIVGGWVPSGLVVPMVPEGSVMRCGQVWPEFLYGPDQCEALLFGGRVV